MGERVYRRVADLPGDVDMVNVFRRSHDVPPHVDDIIAKGLIKARGVYGLFPANADGDDIELYTDASRTQVLDRFHCLRQQVGRDGKPCRSLADFIAPQETSLPDHIGAFAVTSGIGLKALCDKYRAAHDDYSAIMAEAIADRLAEAFARLLHLQHLIHLCTAAAQRV